MSSTEPPQPPTPPGGGTPPPPPPPSTPPPGTPGGYGGYGGYGDTPPPAPGGYGGATPHAGGAQPGNLLDRFLARLIDGVLFAVVSVILGIVFAAILISSDSTTVNLQTGQVDTGSRAVYNLVSSLITTALVLGYFAFLESSRGQTLGKMAMKLKVVAPDGSNPTLVQALKRNIWLAAGLLGILGTFGSVLSFLISIGAVVLIIVGITSDVERRQTWFDTFGGDLQVRKIG
ncbi:MAG: RDD family protein [Nocardioides sp.]|nr:RDD family protein [Nocardioides sp.]